MIVVTCPKCDKQLNLPETNIGKRVRCVACQAIVLVPAPATPPPLPQYEPPPDSEPPHRHQQYDEPAGQVPEEAPPRSYREQSAPRRIPWMPVVLVGLALVAGTLVVLKYVVK
jgi:hypothetical protein